MNFFVDVRPELRDTDVHGRLPGVVIFSEARLQVLLAVVVGRARIDHLEASVSQVLHVLDLYVDLSI